MLGDKTSQNVCAWDAASQGGEFREQLRDHRNQANIFPGMSATEQGHTNVPGAQLSHAPSRVP